MLEQQAKQIIDEILRPLVAADGGEIEFVRVLDRKVIVRLTGMCSGCPGRPYTLSGIVEPLVREHCGQDVQVEAENS